MGGVRLKDLKSHTNAAGGSWGDDTWAALVKDNCEEAFDNTDDGVEGLEDTQAKRALLIPISVFQSSQIIKIATMLGQTEDYKKFGVDEETPSGVEHIRNSTQNAGTSLNLVLSDVSSIMTVEEEEDGQDNIIFEELQRPNDENFLEEEEVEEDEQTELLNEESVVNDETTNETDGMDDDDEMNFTCMDRRAPKSTTMKSKPSRNITVVERNEETFFVCPCGFSSTNKSGSTRHKCRSQGSVLFACKDCDKICKNPGSLRRHTMSIHKNRLSMSLPAHTGSKPSNLSTAGVSKAVEHKCPFCEKVLVNKRNLSNHIDKLHGPGTSDSIATCTPSGLADGSNGLLSVQSETSGQFIFLQFLYNCFILLIIFS